MKVGDRVIIKWSQERKDRRDFYGIGEDNILKMEGKEGIIVELPPKDWPDPDPLIGCEGFINFWIPIDCLIFIDDNNSKPNCVSLKEKNSAPEATNCYSCGGLLKEPYPRIKFCPKCES